MTEGEITLPIGHDEAHKWLRRAVTKAFGGYTAMQSFGGWLSPTGEVIEEPNLIYRVAIDPSRANELRLIAIEAGTRAKQQAVYLKNPDRTVEIISL